MTKTNYLSNICFRDFMIIISNRIMSELYATTTTRRFVSKTLFIRINLNMQTIMSCLLGERHVIFFLFLP